MNIKQDRIEAEAKFIITKYSNLLTNILISEDLDPRYSIQAVLLVAELMLHAMQDTKMLTQDDIDRLRSNAVTNAQRSADNDSRRDISLFISEERQ